MRVICCAAYLGRNFTSGNAHTYKTLKGQEAINCFPLPPPNDDNKTVT